MKITRNHLRKIINEQVFGIRTMSQSPVLDKLNIDSPSERKKINDCKRAVQIINELGLSSSKLFISLSRAVKITAAYYMAEKDGKNIGSAFRNYSKHHLPSTSFMADEFNGFLHWLSTTGREINPPARTQFKGVARGQMPTSGNLRTHIPEQILELIPLLHNISQPGVKLPGLFNAFRQGRKLAPERPDPDAYYGSTSAKSLYKDTEEAEKSYTRAMQRYDQESEENMTNLEREVNITIPGRQSVLNVLSAADPTSGKQIFGVFLEGVSKCSSLHKGPAIDSINI